MPKVEWNGDRLMAAAQQRVKDINFDMADTVLEKARDLCPIAPVDGGQTRNSGTVNPAGEMGTEISFNTPQAAWLHESENYTPSHAGTGPNYLRQPLLDEEAAYHQAVADAMKAIFG